MQTKHAEATIVTLKNYAAYLEKGEQQFLTDPSIKQQLQEANKTHQDALKE